MGTLLMRPTSVKGTDPPPENGKGGRAMYDEHALIDDVRGGLTDSEIMQKYNLPAADLREKILHLSRDKVLKYSDIYWRPILYDYGSGDDERRSIPRYPLKLLLPVEERGSLESAPGFLIDVNERGGCLQGVQTEVGARLDLAIYPEGLISAETIGLDAVIQWVEEGEGTPALAGFEIAAISETDLALLKDLIRNAVRRD
jgi:hypothetical protein